MQLLCYKKSHVSIHCDGVLVIVCLSCFVKCSSHIYEYGIHLLTRQCYLSHDF